MTIYAPSKPHFSPPPENLDMIEPLFRSLVVLGVWERGLRTNDLIQHLHLPDEKSQVHREEDICQSEQASLEKVS